MLVDIEDSRTLIPYLRNQGLIKFDEECNIELLSGGVSNKTVLLTKGKGVQWVIKQALDKLRVEEDWYCDESRITIEYQGLKWFSEILPKGSIPQPVFFDEGNHIFCMTAVPKPHYNLRTLILDEVINPILFKKLGVMLGVFQNAGRHSKEAKSLFHDKRFFIDLRMEPFYLFTASQIPEAERFLKDLVKRTLKISETISHGDYSPKNVLVRNDEVVLLDFEVTHYGDPAFDIGFFLCQVLSFANHLPHLKLGLQEAALAFWNSYIKTIGIVEAETEKRSVDHTLGCLLARVKGRSPVNFLTPDEQNRQVQLALEIIEKNILTIPKLVESFISKLNPPE